MKWFQKVAIFRKDGACIERNKYVASFPERLISNWNNQIPYAIITVKFSFAVRVFCRDNHKKGIRSLLGPKHNGKCMVWNL